MSNELPVRASTASGQLMVIEPRGRWQALDLRELWAYRELLWVLGARDVRVRYKQTLLGAGWAIIRPLLTMVVFSVVFGRLAKIPSEGLPYPIFVFSALLPWTFFAGAVGAAGASLLGSANLISKVYFPRLIVPLAAIGTGLVDLLISTAVLLMMMVYYGIPWTWQLLAAPALLVALICAALGVGTLVAALSVTYRDVQHILPFVIQIWMFVSPVIYPIALFPAKWRWLLYLNPLTGLIEGFRSAFLGKPFDGVTVGVSLLAAVVLLVVGVAYFEKVERRLADIL